MSRREGMDITPEESQAYQWATRHGNKEPFTHGQQIQIDLANALRRRVANEMRLEFEKEHPVSTERKLFGRLEDTILYCQECGMKSDNWDTRHNYTDVEWDHAAHKALLGGKSDG